MAEILTILFQIGQITLEEAEVLTTDVKISEMHSRLTSIPAWGFQLIIPLLIVATLGVVLVWHRQTKIARNQVQLAKLIEEKLHN
ncbi:MAG: hypothetical protein JW709_02420 [Sedimentisphaerales bacterium]|nr:hypothetical protein [Sedimentisphaerales bacterium]